MGDAGAGSGGAENVANQAEAPPDVLPGFEIAQPGSDAGIAFGGDAGLSLVTAPNWCERAGDEDQQVDIAIEIATDFVAAVQADCSTAGLTSPLSEAQLEDWSAYIVDYTVLWFYCPLEYDVPPGGIMIFGPGNVAAIGGNAPVLGADDAQRLTAHYVTAFSTHMELTEPEAEALGRYIEGTAVIDAGTNSGLSICEGSP
jgi:hypothetical protein